jgi:predicted ferric reductase
MSLQHKQNTRRELMKIPGMKPQLSTIFCKGGVLLGAALLLGGALAVPFYYETQTLWYKTGTDKVMLRSGQLAGLFALVVLIGQILLALRVHFIAHLFGGARLMRWHQLNGVLIFIVSCSHVLLVLAPEGFDNLPIGMKYWPEMMGGLLWLFLLIMVFTSLFRSWLHLEYARWRMLHRPLGYLSLVLVFCHVLFVSESFTRGLPRVVLLTLGAGLAMFIGLVQVRRRISKK